MTGFVVGVVVVLLVAVGPVLVPFLKKSVAGTPVGAGTGRRWLPAAALGLALPVAATALYLRIGSPAAMHPAPPVDAQQVTPDQINQMVERLAERMKANPNEAGGWVMLGRSYRALGRIPEAVSAYAAAARLLPKDGDVLADYADMLASANDGSLIGKPEAVILDALKADPTHVKVLALAGSLAYEKGQPGAAADHWRKALAQVPADSEIAQAIKASIDEAEALAKAGGGASRPVKP